MMLDFNIILKNMYTKFCHIYPEGQDSRPFPPHKPMEYGIFVGQIIEEDGKPKMNMDVRWEYELREDYHMSKFHIIGTGACGFLRLHFLLRDVIPVKYKGGRGKYQNSFENWNDHGLIWNSESLSREERLRRVSSEDTLTNITHVYVKYISEFLELHPDMKFLCFKGRKDHSIKSLAVSWGYRNPCYVKDRNLGIGHNRYAVDQFPELK